MNGLQIYINSVSSHARDKNGVFYSRRAGGPYYRWRYEERLNQWLFSRLTAADKLILKTLRITNWKTVPIALQTTLSEHYFE